MGRGSLAPLVAGQGWRVAQLLGRARRRKLRERGGGKKRELRIRKGQGEKRRPISGGHREREKTCKIPLRGKNIEER